jgi:small subunit ribosomal protein S12
MLTINQLTLKNKRNVRKKTCSRTPILKSNPQRKGTCTRVYKMTPKKPCSARRPVAWVLFIKHFERRGALCHIPGETHNLRIYSRVLINGHRVKDLPGVKYRVIRTSNNSICDLQGLYRRRKGRSRYGTKNLNIVKKVRLYRKFRENTELMQQLYFMSNSLYL